jgi:hypothetical protein
VNGSTEPTGMTHLEEYVEWHVHVYFLVFELGKSA